MKRDYEQLSTLIHLYNINDTTSRNETIKLVEVDASVQKNSAAIGKYVTSGFPTLKLFRSGDEVSEFKDVRRASLMYDFLMRAVSIASKPDVEHLRTQEEVKRFLQLMKDRPVILSVLHENRRQSDMQGGNVELDREEWTKTISIMREHTLRNAGFATVQQTDLLIPEGARARYETACVSHAGGAVAAAAGSGESFEGTAEWYFSGVHGNEPLRAFMYAATIGAGSEGIILTRYNREAVLQTGRTMAIGTGSAEVAGWKEREFLRAARMAGVLAVYAGGMEADGVRNLMDLKAGTGETEYAIVRFGNKGTVVRRFEGDGGDEHGVAGWVVRQAREIESGKVRTKAGIVMDLDLKQWDELREFDGRGMLVEFYRRDCASCRRFEAGFTAVAKRLGREAGGVVVGRFDVQKGLPDGVKMNEPQTVPRVGWFGAGEDVIWYDGWLSIGGICRFAREMNGNAFGGLDALDVARTHVLMCGMCVVMGGLMISLLSRNREKHREQEKEARHMT